MKDEELLSVLLNKTSTRQFMKRIKKSHPDKWLRVFGNITMAVEDLRDVKVHKSFFQIGVYDPAHSASWPWHFNQIDGLYLSANFRVCKLGKAIEFETTEAARAYIGNWTNAHEYKCELIEFKKWMVMPPGTQNTSDEWQLKRPILKSL